MNRNISIDLKLLKKYDTAGPRYTSYPTVPNFHNDIGAKEYLREISMRNKEHKDDSISLYFHIPFCDSMCFFCGCNMLIAKKPEFIEHYLNFIIKEMDLLLPYLRTARNVGQMHWGGGSPNTLSSKQIERLGNEIKKRFDFNRGAEVSVEIDPRGLTFNHLQALKEAGFNRFSMGIQDFNPRVQKAINRIQSEEITWHALKWGRQLGFMSINLDLVYGLPYQTPENFLFTLEQVIKMVPDRIVVFNFAYMPERIKRQRIIDPNSIPSGEIKLALLQLTINTLTNNGYMYIGMDHFAKPEDDLYQALKNRTLYRNFQGYSTHAGLDVYAFGMTAISQLPGIYVQNHKTLRMYYRQLEQNAIPVMRGYVLSEDDLLRRQVIMNLMCHFYLNKKEIEERYKINFDQYFKEELKGLSPFIADQLLKISDDEIIVNETGRIIIRNIAMVFDAYVKDKKHQFSKTI